MKKIMITEQLDLYETKTKTEYKYINYNTFIIQTKLLIIKLEKEFIIKLIVFIAYLFYIKFNNTSLKQQKGCKNNEKLKTKFH